MKPISAELVHEIAELLNEDKSYRRRKRRPKYAAFISYAKQDAEFASSLKLVIEETVLGAKVFVAKDELPIRSPEFQREIVHAIRDSQTMVPILTRTSLARPWLIYERGVAAAYGVPVFALRGAGLCRADVRKTLPGPDWLDQPLDAIESLSNLCQNVYKLHNERAELNELERRGIEQNVCASKHAAAIVAKAKVRWVFIAGSTPTGRPTEMIEQAVTDVADALFKAGFSLMFCPQVPQVGERVMQYVSDHPEFARRVAFGGMWPMRVVQAIPDRLDAIWRNEWKKIQLGYRTSYLRHCEWLVIVGGGRGTEEEVEAALACNVKVCAIPDFGGYASAAGRTSSAIRVAPLSLTWGPEAAGRIVDVIREL